MLCRPFGGNQGKPECVIFFDQLPCLCRGLNFKANFRSLPYALGHSRMLLYSTIPHSQCPVSDVRYARIGSRTQDGTARLANEGTLKMAKLTEQEQQEVIRFVEAGKPLPEKYRFLLFDDKREVELVWNGKTNEVCNVVLPFQVIEQVDEPRAEKPEERSPGAVRCSRTATQGLDEQAHLGRQQADPLVAEERPAARGDRSAGRIQADLHRPAL